MLPATQSTAKELLPVLNVPAIQWIAEEAAASHASQLVVVRSPSKEAVVTHFRQRPELIAKLRASSKATLAATVERILGIIDVADVVQDEPLGLGHAVLVAEEAVGDDEVFAVSLPDDLLLPCGVLDQMMLIRDEFGGSVLCAVKVNSQETPRYGILAVENAARIVDGCDTKKVTGMLEKPSPEDAPSNLAAAGRYLLDREIFTALRAIKPGKGGELQLTDAIDLLIEWGCPVHVLVHQGKRLDLGNPEGFVLGNVEVALQNPDIRNAVLDKLRAIIDRENDS